MKKTGSLYVLEGTDGAGKGTQHTLIAERLKQEGYNILEEDYPQYDKFSSILVRMYLNGRFGPPKRLGAYIPSTFYALDRWQGKKRMKEHIANGGIIISNRYKSANDVHQSSKIQDPKKLDKFLNWLEWFEFDFIGIPRPDKVFFLNLAYEIGQANVSKKDNRAYIKNGNADIHEKDKDHLRESHARAVGLVDRFDYWEEIKCDDGKGHQFSREQIHEEIYKRIKKDLETKLAA